MLNTHKLLYILPDLAYIAEVLPDKKPNTFVIQSFTQLNGDLLSDEDFIPGSVIKLFSKLEADGEYQIILPDFLFTTTMVSINEKSETKVQEELKNNILPKMGLTAETHLIETAILNEVRGVSRIQISAIEKSILAPLRVGASEYKIKITGISPLSWTIKSLVSLEPSITVLQMGSNLYTSEHYIGVDQPTMASVDSPEIVIETIKTLKGSEPSIQTVYLLGNTLIEEKLKTALSKTLPIQQMATTASDNEKMPSYVKQVIEYSMKTLSIADFPVPKFPLTKASVEELDQFQNAIAADMTVTDSDEDVVVSLPKPDAPKVPIIVPDVPAISSISEPIKEPELPEEEEEIELDETDEPDEPEELTEDRAEDEKPEVIEEAVIEVQEVESLSDNEEESATEPEPEKVAVVKIAPVATIAVPVANDDIDLTQFVQSQSAVEPVSVKEIEEKKPVISSSPTIKNKSGTQSMLKMIFIALAVFGVTVAVGVGVGLAIIKFSSANTPASTPTVQVESTPAPTTAPEVVATASPSAAPATTAQTASFKVLIVNATKKAGYAGTFKTKIETAKLGKVTAGNAKGTYTGGFKISLKKPDADLLKKYSNTTGLDLTEDDKAATAEDPQGTYDVVIVLAE